MQYCPNRTHIGSDHSAALQQPGRENSLVRAERPRDNLQQIGRKSDGFVGRRDQRQTWLCPEDVGARVENAETANNAS